jgi:5-methylcytosine-specific restriction endonuclease McrA
MRVQDHAAQIAQALHALTNESIDRGSDDVSRYAQALDEYAAHIRKMREGMKCSPVCICRDCGRTWTVTMTVKREREVGSGLSTCPACFNAKQGDTDHASAWTNLFRYIDSEKEIER